MKRLPSGFLFLLAAAALPGPVAAQLVGSAFQVAAGTTLEHPAVAYGAGSGNQYLVVWLAPTATTTAELRGQFVGFAGTPTGAPFVIEAAVDRAVPPALCHVRRTDEFVVGYRRRALGTFSDTNWYVRTIAAAGGAVSNREVVPFDAATTGELTELVLGGDARVLLLLPDDRALLVVRRAGPTGGQPSIAYALVTTLGADPVVGTFTTLSSPGVPVGDIAVTERAGDEFAGHWLVVWCQSVGLSPFTSVRGRLVDTDGVACGASTTLHTGLVSVRNPTVAVRDTDEFAVAWEHGADIRVRSVAFTGTCAAPAFTLGTTVDPTSGTDNSEPALAFARDKFLLAWRRSPTPFPAGILVRGLDPDACIACGQEWAPSYPVAAQGQPALGARYAAGDLTSDEALTVWADGAIVARRFEAMAEDLVLNLGGGCTNTGYANAATHDGECVIGNDSFRLVLGAPTVPALALIVGFSAISFPCGACTIVPSPDLLLPGATPTTVPIPCDTMLIGTHLWSQWLLLKPSTCPLLPDFSFTNALRFTIGE
ncbi:MAG: hypothetical protein JNL08_09530 [Planctomycetes bacterium]|nr:hypothetical protein [Planctomycetota bacterium]